jgi:broad specificity phosphatase PhoE
VKTIYLVRHGESESNAGGITQAQAVIGLTELGRRQAQAVAPLLPAQPAGVWVSPFIRTRHTSGPYCEQTGCTPVTLDLLREFESIDPALIAGLNGKQRRPIADAFWEAAEPDRRMGVNAETFREFAQRVQQFREHQLPQLPDAAVLFGHGTWMAMLYWQLQGFRASDGPDMAAFRRFQSGLPMRNCVIYRLRDTAPGEWSMELDDASLVAESMTHL